MGNFMFKRLAMPASLQRIADSIPSGGGLGGVGEEPYVCIRCGLASHEPFTWAHKAPPDHPRGHLRTCGGTVVRASEVAATREAEHDKFAAQMEKIAKAESGWRS